MSANPLPNIGTLLVEIEAEELRLVVEMSMIGSLDDGEDDGGNGGGAGMVEPKDGEEVEGKEAKLKQGVLELEVL